jgi:hypothetical protein
LGNLSSDIKRKNTEDDLRLSIDLKEMFDLPFFPQDDGLRQAIGQAIIDAIKAKAESSDFLSGSSKKGYSKEYAESDEGVVYGKKAGAKANLTASGDMLNSMDVSLPSNNNKLEIFFIDNLESNKAHGHVNGSNILPKRDFFGLTAAELKDVAREFDRVVIDAAALELADTGVSQGDQGNLDFISGLLNAIEN